MSTSIPNPARYGAMASAIREAMETKKLTTAKLAKRLGTSAPTVHGWLAHKNGPSPAFRLKLTQHLGLDPAVLVTKRANTKESATEHLLSISKNAVRPVRLKQSLAQASTPTTIEVPAPRWAKTVHWHLRAMAGSEILVDVHLNAEVAQAIINQLMEGKFKT